MVEAEDGIEHDHGKDNQCVLQATHRTGDRRGGEQHQNEKALELGEHDDERRTRRRFRETVCAMNSRPPCSLLRAQPCAPIDALAGERLRCARDMPARIVDGRFTDKTMIRVLIVHFAHCGIGPRPCLPRAASERCKYSTIARASASLIVHR